VRSFLEKEGEFQLGEAGGFLFGKFAGPFQGIALPEDALQKIYHGNFERLAGSQPKALNPQAIAAECERLVTMMGILAQAQPDNPMDPSIALMVKDHFLNQTQYREET